MPYEVTSALHFVIYCQYR